jgi:hypothetical protein
MIVTRFFCKTEILRGFLCTLKAGIFSLKRFSLLSKTEKSRVRDRFISYSKYSRRGTLFIQKKVGSALTETENWDIYAGVHLSDKRTLLMKTHIPFQTQYK